MMSTCISVALLSGVSAPHGASVPYRPHTHEYIIYTQLQKSICICNIHILHGPGRGALGPGPRPLRVWAPAAVQGPALSRCVYSPGTFIDVCICIYIYIYIYIYIIYIHVCQVYRATLYFCYMKTRG